MRHSQSQSFTRKKKIRMWWAIMSLIAIFVSIVFLISFLLRSQLLTIVDVTVFGADADITSNIRDLTFKELSGSYLGLFPHANSLIYPKQNIISQIKKTFLRVLDVNISRDDFTHLRVSVNEKTPSAVVCVMLPNFDASNVILFEQEDPCYFADSTGLLFEKISSFPLHTYHVYYAPDITTHASTTNLEGTYATSTDEFNALQVFYNGIESTNIIGNAILFKNNGEYELYSSSTVIYFNNSQKLVDELANLTAFWNHTLTIDRANKKQTIFDYIDLRYGSNVFYKSI